MYADAPGVDALVELYIIDAREGMLVFSEYLVVLFYVKPFAGELRAVKVIVHWLDDLVADLVRRIGEDDVYMPLYPLHHAAEQLVEAVAREYRADYRDVPRGELRLKCPPASHSYPVNAPRATP